jgi:hypothetical protein
MQSSKSDCLLYVYLKGGPTLQFVVPSIAELADIDVLALEPYPLNAEQLWRDKVLSVREMHAFGESQVDGAAVRCP